MRPLIAVLFAGLVLVLGLPTSAAATQPVGAASLPAATTQPVGAAAPGAPPSGDSHGPVVFVGVSGLTFEDLDPYRTPNLWALVEDGTIGTITPRSVRATSCPVDGWLAVGSGSRAADEPRPTCRRPASPVESWVPDWAVYRLQAEDDNYEAPLGALREAIPDVHAIGPGAAIAAAEPRGRVGSYDSAGEDLAGQVRAATGPHSLTIVDLGNTRESGYSLAELDEQLGQIRAAVDSLPDAEGEPTLLVASISDGWNDSSEMQFAAAVGPEHQGGVMTSASTKQPGLIQTTDILPTLLSATGTGPTGSMPGARITATAPDSEASTRYQQMLDRQVAVATQAALSAWFFPVVATIMAVLLVVAYAVGRRDRSRVAGPVRSIGLFFAAAPVSTYLVNLVPWERSTSPDVAMLAALAGWALALTLVGLLGPWRRHPLGPITAVAAITVIVLAVDVITGSQLQMSTLLGEPLLIASRFYGIGNSALALYCTALVFVLVAACSAVRGRWSRLTVVLVGLVLSCLLLATPGLGTKFGSVPTLIIGLAVLALAAAGIRLSVKRLVLIVGTAGMVMLAVLVIDWLRPAEQRTHFGRFFDSILSGEAGAVLVRKIGMNIDILTQSWLTLLLPVIIAGVFWVILDPHRFSVPHLPELYRRFPLLRAGMVSLLVLLTVGTIINDSGIVVPAVGILFVIPAFAHLVGQAEVQRARTDLRESPREGRAAQDRREEDRSDAAT
ncbi:hypothetical protein GCM10022261_04070 [Brevibacterium daeguense]|uniref:Uncharacterized protein n=1 Tax=Brevibacterium daeguense TaxID=909936 RepID=A0ABP8EG18_9MICO|nr:hypothetical protein [Brevibacterium daeguense]